MVLRFIKSVIGFSKTMIRVFNLNIQSRKHLGVFPDRINQYKPDVVCLQEVFKVDVETIKDKLGMKNSLFVSAGRVMKKNKWNIPAEGSWGQLILTNLDAKYGQEVYSDRGEKEPLHNEYPNSINRLLTWAKVKKNNDVFNVVNAHFTWLGEEKVSVEQNKDYEKMMKIINKFDDVLVCGDFNFHRGRSLWKKMSTDLIDNVPDEVLSTLDPRLFRVPDLEVVCDGFFTKGNHVASGVEVVCGMSDHCGITGELNVL